ncbi:MAG: helix-turn-helix domain-containing protein, partial [Spirochaetales bacterium]|nr:helix-turn-helix domain-containing protein [Spirochaetales bacterium]
MKYLDTLRIRTAKDLLLHTALRVNEIAQMCGIYDYQYFSKKFHLLVGMSPLKYRQKGEPL